MVDPINAVVGVIQSVHPEWRAPVIPIRPGHDDDLAAAGDERRDQEFVTRLVVDDDTPDPWTVA